MISDLESMGREVDFEEFLDGITSKLGDKESRVHILWCRTESTRFSISSMTTILAWSTPTTSKEWQRNLEKLWTYKSWRRCCKELHLMDAKSPEKISTISWQRSLFDGYFSHFINSDYIKKSYCGHIGMFLCGSQRQRTIFIAYFDWLQVNTDITNETLRRARYGTKGAQKRQIHAFLGQGNTEDEAKASTVS